MEKPKAGLKGVTDPSVELGSRETYRRGNTEVCGAGLGWGGQNVLVALVEPRENKTSNCYR